MATKSGLTFAFSSRGAFSIRRLSTPSQVRRGRAGSRRRFQISWMTECVVAAVSLQVLSYHATCSKTEVDKFKVTHIQSWLDTHTVHTVTRIKHCFVPELQWSVLWKSNSGYVLFKVMSLRTAIPSAVLFPYSFLSYSGNELEENVPLFLLTHHLKFCWSLQ